MKLFIISTIFSCLTIGCNETPSASNGTLRIEIEKITCINSNVYLVIDGKNVMIVDQYTQLGINCNLG